MSTDLYFPEDNETTNGRTLEWEEVSSRINTISNSADSIASKIYDFTALKKSSEDSIRNYELAIKNSNNELEITRWRFQIAQLEAQTAVIDQELRALEIKNKLTATKWIIGGVAVISVVGILIYAMKK